MRVLRVMVLGVALPLLIVTTTAAQGVQTGEVSGTVSSSDGLTLPGATITAAGPALQGVRTVVADAKGNYVIRALPPGTYKVTFEMSGLVATLGERRHRARPADRRQCDAGAGRSGGERERHGGSVHGRPHLSDGRRELHGDRDQSTADRPHTGTHRGAGARAHGEHAEHRSGHHLRRLRVRQRLHDQRRRRERQLVRQRAAPSSSRMRSSRRAC